MFRLLAKLYSELSKLQIAASKVYSAIAEGQGYSEELKIISATIDRIKK